MSIVARIGLIEPAEGGMRLTLAAIPGESKGQDYLTIVGPPAHLITEGDMIWGGDSVLIIVHQDGARSEYARAGYTTLEGGHIVSGT